MCAPSCLSSRRTKLYWTEETATEAERTLHEVCLEYGFPAKEQFKWSPGSELWMHDNLRDPARQDFFVRVLSVLSRLECKAVVVVVDSAFPGTTHWAGLDRSLDAVVDLIGQVDERLSEAEQLGLLLMDQPGGGPIERREFCSSCAEYWGELARGRGDRRIVVPPVATDSRHIRLLQAADLVTSCTVSPRFGRSNVFTRGVSGYSATSLAS